MSFSLVQAWAHTNAASSTGVSLAFAAVPTAGNLLVAFTSLGTSLTDTHNTPTDDIGDGVPWALAKGPQSNGVADRGYLWWKQVGTPSGGQKTVTVTSSGTESQNIIAIAEYTAGVGGVITLDGTPVGASSAGTSNPVAGSITTTTANGLIVAVCSDNNAVATAGTGFTSRYTFNTLNPDTIEDQYTSVAQAYTAAFVDPSAAFWYAIAAAWKVGAAAPSSGNRIIMLN